jgi:DNA-binding IscR family transcriptional regulator
MVVKAIDGEEILHSCSLGLKECSDRFPCPIHNQIKTYKERLRKVMKEKTVQQLAGELAKGKTYLRNYKIKLTH